MKRRQTMDGDRLWRVHIPEGADYKGRKFVAHSLLSHAETPEKAIDCIIWQVGYPEGLKYEATEIFYDQDGDPIDKAHGYDVERPIPKFAEAQRRTTGRPAADIPLNLICDALEKGKNEKSIIEKVARDFGVSRAYLYKYIGKKRINEILKKVS